MKKLRLLNRTRHSQLAERALVADTHWTRLRGLLGRPRLQPGQGMLLRPCRSVHTHAMFYRIDVVFLDDQGAVTALYPELAPWRQTGFHAEAREVVELPEGSIAETGTRTGDRIEAVPVDPGAFPRPPASKEAHHE